MSFFATPLPVKPKTDVKRPGLGIGLEKHSKRMEKMYARIEAHAKSGKGTSYEDGLSAYGNKHTWDANVSPSPVKKRKTKSSLKPALKRKKSSSSSCGVKKKRVSFCATVKTKKPRQKKSVKADTKETRQDKLRGMVVNVRRRLSKKGKKLVVK